MNSLFYLHLPSTATPHSFEEEPKSVFVAVPVTSPEAGTHVRRFVNLELLPYELRERVLGEIARPNPPKAAQKPFIVGDVVGDVVEGIRIESVRVIRIEPETVLHDDLDSFVAALADCRAVSGDLWPCDDPRSRRVGYVHHPDVGPSVVHEIGLRSIRGSTVSDEVAARIGLEPHEVRALLATYEGRHALVTGSPPEPVPDQDDLLEAVMMADPVRVDVRLEGDGVANVEFPDVDLFRGADLLGSLTPPAFREHRTRPDWMPVGWAVLRFPEDKDRAGAIDDPSPVAATGAFARRGDCLFRAFDDGRWDESVWQAPADKIGSPAGYRIIRSGNVGKPDVQAALAAVLPAYQATAPALKNR